MIASNNGKSLFSATYCTVACSYSFPSLDLCFDGHTSAGLLAITLLCPACGPACQKRQVRRFANVCWNLLQKDNEVQADWRLRNQWRDLPLWQRIQQKNWLCAVCWKWFTTATETNAHVGLPLGVVLWFVPCSQCQHLRKPRLWDSTGNLLC